MEIGTDIETETFSDHTEAEINMDAKTYGRDRQTDRGRDRNRD